MRTFFVAIATGLLAAAVFSSCASAALSSVSAKEIAQFLVAEGGRRPNERTPFEIRLAAELTANVDLAAASRNLAHEFAINESQTRKLSELWIWSVLYSENKLFGYEAAVSREEMDRREKAFRHDLQNEFLALVGETNQAAIVVQSAANTLTSHPFDCERALFSKIVGNKGEETAWLAADAANCTEFWLAANARQPMNDAILLRIAEYGPMPRAQRIAVLEDMHRRLPASHPDYLTLGGYLARNLMYHYWDAGMFQEGLNLYRRLPAPAQKVVAENVQPPVETTLGGHKLKIPMTAAEFPLHDVHEFHEQLAVALVLAGAPREAKTVLNGAGKFGTDAKAALACSLSGTSNCGRLEGQQLRWLYLDFTFNRPEEDPYDFFEATDTSFSSDVHTSAIWLDVLLKTTRGTDYASIADRMARLWDSDAQSSSYREKEHTELFNSLSPTLRGRTEQLNKDLIDRERRYDGALKPAAQEESRPAPKSAHFAELKMPPCGRRPEVNKHTATTLPEGYAPVRAERHENMAVAVSLSQNYDTAGEVSGGGYWIHLSTDGGKTWGAPLYTGLAQMFPYEVMSSSCLPMISGDHLQIEVEVREIDTASITYPPVGLRLRHEVKGLYLKTPLGELRKDTDGDGLTDIAEETLLLDPAKGDTDGDGTADGNDPFPNVAFTGQHRPNDGAMAAVLKKLNTAGFGALIEPVDRRPGEIGGWGSASISLDRPLFIQGNKQDFGGFSSKQMILVYSEEDVSRIRRSKPDFHPIWFGPLVLNRAGTRGFIRWSAGWTGGSYRLLKDGRSWRVEDLGSWIT